MAIGKAMRSCYTEFVVSKRRTTGAGLVDVEPSDPEKTETDNVVQEVEAFLAEHDSLSQLDGPVDIYEEHEAAEALAGVTSIVSSTKCSGTESFPPPLISRSHTGWRSRS